MLEKHYEQIILYWAKYLNKKKYFQKQSTFKPIQETVTCKKCKMNFFRQKEYKDRHLIPQKKMQNSENY